MVLLARDCFMTVLLIHSHADCHFDILYKNYKCVDISGNIGTLRNKLVLPVDSQAPLVNGKAK